MNDKPYRPSLSQQDMTDILAALEVDNEQRLKAAVREKDAEAALAALEHRQRVDNLLDRFVRMAYDRIPKPKNPQVPGQVSMEDVEEMARTAEADMAFDDAKAKAEAEERSDTIVDFYQEAQA